MGCGLVKHDLVPGAVEMSDVFSGTAQAYSVLHPAPSTSAVPPGLSMTSAPMASYQTPGAEQRIDHTHQELATSVEKGRGQLEVLYSARCRQVEVLSQQLRDAREEGEREVRILRHEKVSV